MPGNRNSALPQLTSPRAAAIAGIVFSLLMTTLLILIHNILAIDPADISQKWIKANTSAVSLPLLMVPFAGITFLYFTGVLRDWLADREDRFFSTVFLGSGILFVGMLFVWAAAAGAMFGMNTVAGDRLTENDIYVFAYMFMNEIVGDYNLRLMGVYMGSTATLWIRTGVMPRWLTITTYGVAVAFIILGPAIKGARFGFPGWVFLVSIYILFHHSRSTRRDEGPDMAPGGRKS